MCPHASTKSRNTLSLIKTLVLFTFLFIPPLVATAGNPELEEFQSAIRLKYDLKEQAFRDNDIEPIINRFYSADVISTDNEGITHIGRDALRPVYEEVIALLVTIESFDTFVKGDAGWDWVNFHVTYPPEIEGDPFTFKMLFLWERVDGEWWSRGEMFVLGKFDLSGAATAH